MRCSAVRRCSVTRMPEAMMVAPLSGKVVAINRGARRVLQSVVIEVSDSNDTGFDFLGRRQCATAPKA